MTTTNSTSISQNRSDIQRSTAVLVATLPCTHRLFAPESVARGYCEACFQAAKPADWPSTIRWKDEEFP
jgi:hypothetical protein